MSAKWIPYIVIQCNSYMSTSLIHYLFCRRSTFLLERANRWCERIPSPRPSTSGSKGFHRGTSPGVGVLLQITLPYSTLNPQYWSNTHWSAGSSAPRNKSWFGIISSFHGDASIINQRKFPACCVHSAFFPPWTVILALLPAVLPSAVSRTRTLHNGQGLPYHQCLRTQ